LKTQWEYRYITEDFLFEKDYKYIGTIESNDPAYLAEGYPTKFEFRFKIIPSKNKKVNGSKQSGDFIITVPFEYDKAKNVITTILYNIYQRMTFQYGKLKLLGGLIMGEHIPETDKEKEMIGENKYFAHLSIEEVGRETIFNSKAFQNNLKNPLDIGLVSQFNQAVQSKHIINKFIGLFKILEDTYSRNKKGERIKEVLKNDDLFNIYSKIVKNENKTRENFESLIDSIVEARHKCSHLKNNKKYGFLPDDPRLEEEVRPYLNIIEILSFEVIIAGKKN